jgi:hypothetical protein
MAAKTHRELAHTQNCAKGWNIVSITAALSRSRLRRAIISDALRAIIVQLIISLQKPQHTVPKSAFWQHSAMVAGLRKQGR